MCRAMAEVLFVLMVVRARKAVIHGRSRRFDGGPARGFGLGGIAGYHPGFGVTAFRAFECAMLETFGTRGDGGRHHPHLAVWTTRTVGRQQLWIGFRHPRHGEKNTATSKKLSVRCPTKTRKKRLRFQFTPRFFRGEPWDRVTRERCRRRVRFR
jgi:hypothetical protein